MKLNIGVNCKGTMPLCSLLTMKQITDKPILLIIPDIHGRLFWISATKKYPKLPVIFLGDYLDPYTYYEEILPSEALVNFKEILDFKILLSAKTFFLI